MAGWFTPGSCGCGCSTEAYMYTLGGATSSSYPAGVQTTDKTAMTSQTTGAISSANLTGNRGYHCSFGNPGVAGYTTGGTATGVSPSILSSTDKTDPSTDTTSACGTATLSQARSECTAFAERTTKAYVIAGGIWVSGFLTSQVTADVFTYSTESFSGTSSANVGTAVKWPASMNGNTAKGYVAGGFTVIFSDAVKTAYKVTFSGDSTSAQASAQLSAARYGVYAGSNGNTKGYFAGGQNGSPVTNIDKLTVSTDTSAVMGATLSQQGGSAASNGTILVMFAGSSTDRSAQTLTFSSDALSSFGASGQLSVARLAMAGFSTVAL